MLLEIELQQELIHNDLRPVQSPVQTSLPIASAWDMQVALHQGEIAQKKQ